MRVLVTGTSSGLGRGLRRAFDGDALVRGALDAEIARLSGTEWDAIIHCATDARKELPASDLAAYRHSHLTLTDRLLEVPHTLFVFVSSQAVYPTDGRRWREDEDVPVGSQSIYGLLKLMAEDSVRASATRALVLRPAALVGPEGRSNNIMRILRREPGRLFLSGDCSYNLIAYSQVARFIRESIERGREGTYNIGAPDEATLAELATHLHVPMSFGDHLYSAPSADLTHVQGASDVFSLPTLAVADLVAREIDEDRLNGVR